MLKNGTFCYYNLLNKPKIYEFQKENELTEGLNEFSELEIIEIN